MSVTVSANEIASIPAHKGSGGLSGVFPDVCFVPASPQPLVATPYPAAAGGSATKTPATGTKTPTASKDYIQAGAANVAGLVPRKTYFTIGSGGVKYEGKAVILSLGVTLSNNAANDSNAAIVQARSRMTALHAQLQGMTAPNPGAWHEVLDKYIKAVSSLYILLNLRSP